MKAPIAQTLILTEDGSTIAVTSANAVEIPGSVVVTPTLAALTVSPASATVGTAYSGNISGRTDGSTLALSGAGAAGLSISGTMISGIPTTVGVINVIETLAGATGSPRTSSGLVTVVAAPITLAALTVSPASATVGTAYMGTISGKSSGSTLVLSGNGAAGLSISGTTISGTPTNAGAVNIVETLAGATGSPRTSVGVVTVAAATGTPAIPAASNYFFLSTDAGSDCDDSFAMGVMIRYLMDNPSKTCLGVVTDAPGIYAAPAVRAILDVYGFTNIPVGAYKGSTGNATSTWAQQIVTEFGRPARGLTRNDFPSAATVMRQGFASLPNGVKADICVVGLNGALDEFVQSAGGADGIAASGAELYSSRAAVVVSQGGEWGSTASRFNWAENIAATRRLINGAATYGVPWIILPADEGETVFTRPPPEWNAATNPIKRIYDLSPQNTNDTDERSRSYDQLTVYYMQNRGNAMFSYFAQNIATTISTTDTTHTKNAGTAGLFSWINLARTPATDAAELETYLAGLPQPTNLPSDTTAPTITSANSATRVEGATSTRALTANETVTWSIAGSANGASITGSTLNLPSRTFASGATYTFTIRATDTAGNFTDQLFTDNITATGTGPVINPNSTLYLAFEGANGSTTTTDSTGRHTPTLENGAIISTAQVLRGTSSLRLPGTGRVTIPHSTDHLLSNVPFTLDAVVRFDNLNLTQSFMLKHDSATSQRSWIWEVLSTGALAFVYSTNGTSTAKTISTATGVIVPNTTYVLRIDRDSSGVIRQYINGVMTGAANTGNNVSFFNNTFGLVIGGYSNGTTHGFVSGYMDNVIITKGVALTGSDAGYSIAA